MFRHRENKLLKRALALYAGERVVDGVLREGDAFLWPHAETVELTLLYFDIRSFTHPEDGVEPIALGVWSTRYAQAITETVAKTGGIFDVFIGDSGSAWWGVDGEADHAHRAVIGAQQLLAAMERLNPLSKLCGHPVVQLNIGIHTGPVSLGNFGSALRLRYTVMGNAVNLASRLCSMASNYVTPVVLSDQTYRQLGAGLPVKHLESVRVKGQDELVDLYGIAFQL